MEFSLFSYHVNAHLFKSQSKLKKLLYHIYSEEYDIVCLQGLYTPSVQRKFKNALYKEYKTIAHQLNMKSFPSNIRFDSGLFVSSKFRAVNLSRLNSLEKSEDGHLFASLKTHPFSLYNTSISFNLFELDDSQFLLVINTEQLNSETHIASFREYLKSLVNELTHKNIVKTKDLAVIITQSSLEKSSINMYENEVNELFKSTLIGSTFLTPTITHETINQFEPISPFVATKQTLSV